jgi:phosphosulfolactate phosphohydrolase-like enzyme
MDTGRKKRRGRGCTGGDAGVMDTEKNELIKNREALKIAAEKLYLEAQNGTAALEENDASAYLSSLEARDAVIAHMDALEKQYAVLKGSVSEGERTELQKIEIETREILQLVLNTDASARDKAKALMDEYRKKLKELKKSGKQVSGYMKMYANSDGIFIDRKR